LKKQGSPISASVGFNVEVEGCLVGKEVVHTLVVVLESGTHSINNPDASSTIGLMSLYENYKKTQPGTSMPSILSRLSRDNFTQIQSV